MTELFAKDIERLENTSFANAFGSVGEPVAPTDAVICIDSVACVVSNDCSNGCIDTSEIATAINTVITAVTGATNTLPSLPECVDVTMYGCQSMTCTFMCDGA